MSEFKEEIEKVEDADICELFLNKIQENEKLNDIGKFVGKQFLIQFLRGKKNDWKKAYKTFEGYVGIRRGRYLDYFKSIRPSRTEELMKTGYIKILEQKDSEGRLVFIISNRLWDASSIDVDDCLKLMALFGDQLIRDETVQQVHAIFDLADFTKDHFTHVGPSVIFKIIQFFWNNLPLRYAGIHVINEAYLFGLMVKGIKPFFPKKLGDRLEFHGSDLTSLHGFISPEILPASLGGKLNEEEAVDTSFHKKIMDQEDYYTAFAELL